ncbi:hypothetical protein CEXT_489281 [Caerostris extrusa]|uniref:Uncharacterized protein n=1 Tax=Caerostris extrusa TaxID=172846 RepID=A0AAV4UYZ1_CAEEX|nr:hypothetical protein CEXT_489281 [Caerostris extrusa]
MSVDNCRGQTAKKTLFDAWEYVAGEVRLFRCVSGYELLERGPNGPTEGRQGSLTWAVAPVIESLDGPLKYPFYNFNPRKDLLLISPASQSSSESLSNMGRQLSRPNGGEDSI